MKKVDKNETEEKLSLLLNTYSLPKIEETHKLETIKLLKAYMPIQQEKTIDLMQKLVLQSFIKILSRYKMQLFVLLLLMFVVYTVMPETMHRWIIFVFTSPAPLFLAGWHLMNAQTKDMVELEITYKYSFQQLLFSKIVAITVCSIVIYSGTLLYMILIHNVELSMTLFHIAVSGLTPILLFCLTLLTLSIKYRDPMSWTVIILSWVFLALLSIYTPMGTILLSMNFLIYVLINIALIVLFVYRLNHVWRMERLSHEFY